MEADEKLCPMCAETVKAAAKICKHCRFEFKFNPPSAQVSEPIKAQLDVPSKPRSYPVITLAKWAPFLLVALVCLGTLANRWFVSTAFLGLAALAVFPPTFKSSSVPGLAKASVAGLLFVIGMSTAPSLPKREVQQQAVPATTTVDASQDPASATPPENTSPADTTADVLKDRSIRTIKKDSAIGCQDRKKFEELTMLATQGDRSAWQKVWLADLVSDQCIPFKAGQDVYIVDTAIFSGLVRVRPESETTSYWTNIESVN